MMSFNGSTWFSFKRVPVLRIFWLAVVLSGCMHATQARAANCSVTSGWKGSFSGPPNPLLIPSNTPVGTLIATYNVTVPTTVYASCNAGGTALADVTGAGPKGNATAVPGRPGMYSYAATPGIGYVFKENGIVLNAIGVLVQRTWTIGPGAGDYSYGGNWTMELYKIGPIGYTSTLLTMYAGVEAGGTLGVTGLVQINSVESTCSVLTPNLGIPLGDVDVDIFTGVGSSSPTSSNYNLILSCQGKPNISMSISGVAVPENGGLFGLAGGNTANGVAVQLFRNGSAIVPRQNYLVSTATPDGWLYIPIAARYMQTGGVAPGSANANMTATFTYN